MALLAFLARGLLVSLATELALLVSRKRSAAVRHLIVSIGLVSILAIGVVGLATRNERHSRFKTQVTFVKPISNYVVPSRELPVPTTTASRESRRFTLPHLDNPWLTLWELGVILLASRLFIALMTVGWRVSRAKKLEDDFGLPVLEDSSGGIPVTTWWGRSIVLLPAEWRGFSNENLDSILKHEEAHIRRRDWWFQLVASLVVIVSWPNPLVWLMRKQCAELSELAVDDCVLSSGTPPSRYARDLLQIALSNRRTLDSLSLPMAIRPQISKRIEMLLNQKRQRGAASIASIAGISALFLLVTAGTSMWSLQPKEQAPKTVTQYYIKEAWYMIDYRPDLIKKLSSLRSSVDEKSPAIAELPTMEAADKLAKKCRGKILETPAIRTLDSATATLTCTGQNGSEYSEQLTILGDSYSSKVKVKADYLKGKVLSEETVDFVARPSIKIGTKPSVASCIFCPPFHSKQILIVHTIQRIDP